LGEADEAAVRIGDTKVGRCLADRKVGQGWPGCRAAAHEGDPQRRSGRKTSGCKGDLASPSHLILLLGEQVRRSQRAYLRQDRGSLSWSELEIGKSWERKLDFRSFDLGR
jgi:hypothetical protein